MRASLKFFVVFACLSAALSIAVSAAAAHALTLSAQDAHAMAWALDLQRFHALALLLLVLFARQGGANRWTLLTGALGVAGTLLFSINIELRLLFDLAQGRAWVPYGGMAWMAAWLTMAIACWPARER